MRDNDRAKTLRRAASVIAERGLCKGQYYTADGRVCAIGAINVAGGFGPGHTSRPFGWVESELTNSMMTFNDMRSTTQDDVESLLMSLAEEC